MHVRVFHILLLTACLLGTPHAAVAQPVPVTLGPAEPLPRQLLTFNTDLATTIMFRGVGYDSPQFEDALRELRPQGLRFPGGTLANNYQWSTDSFSEPTNDKTGWAAEHLRLFRKIGRPYDLPGFARIVRRNQLSPIWVLNVYEETPESTLALFDKLDALGLNVTAVELANEPYWDGRSLADVWKYIAAARPLAQVLKDKRPEIKLGACFAPFGNPANYEEIWNAPLAQETWYDAIVFHDYYGGQGFVLEPGQPVSAAAMLHPEAMIDDAVTKLVALRPGTPIWLTEWNVGFEALETWKNTGAELQFIAAMFVSLVDHRQDIPIACFHAIYDARFGAFYIDDATGTVQTNASYELFRLLGTMFSGAETLRPVTFATADLRGFATQQGDDVRLFVLNRGDTDRQIALPAEFAGALLQQTIHAPTAAKLSSSPIAAGAEGHTAQATVAAASAEQVTLPAHSICVIGRPATLAFKPQIAADGNLFPRRPDLLFWYPPYASVQPRFDAAGVYTIDLAACADKPLAVLKMDLASSQLEAGREYALDFDAKTSGEGGLIVKLPQADQTQGRYSVLGQEFTPQRYTFRYDPATNAGEVTFVFPQELLAQRLTVTFRNFQISPAE